LSKKLRKFIAFLKSWEIGKYGICMGNGENGVGTLGKLN
jgi:hypothetical protein